MLWTSFEVGHWKEATIFDVVMTVLSTCNLINKLDTAAYFITLTGVEDIQTISYCMKMYCV